MKADSLDKKTLAFLDEVEAKIGYVFKKKELLLEAVTHRSFARDARLKSQKVSQNERLEFLGDAILSMITALELYHDSPRADEGTLTQLRANYVCEAHLARCAREMNLGSVLRVSASMNKTDKMELPSLLCDLVEAIVGAVYLDSGFDESRDFVKRVLGEVPHTIVAAPKDPKTELQEWTQAQFGKTPIYKVVESSGPAHLPVFVVEVILGDQKLALGEGSSKKEAAQNAAKAALIKASQDKKK